MSSDIISNLQLDKELDSAKVLLVKEINGCSSSFIISCVMGHCIKTKQALFLVTSHSSISHYQNVGVRMNYNLQKCIATGNIQVFDLGQYIVNNILNNEHVSIEQLLLIIKDMILSMQEKYGIVNVIFDGISHLLDVPYDLKDVNYLFKEIINVVRIRNNSFLIMHCNIAGTDDVTNVTANLLCHKAQTVVQVETLSSGWSTDVSGHLSIKHVGSKFDREHCFTMDIKPSLYLFKLFDKGVKLFAPGTV